MEAMDRSILENLHMVPAAALWKVRSEWEAIGQDADADADAAAEACFGSARVKMLRRVIIS
jgi:hypothetical protein